MTKIEELDQIKEQINTLIEYFKEKYMESTIVEPSVVKDPKIVGFNVNGKTYRNRRLAPIYREFILDLCKNPFITKEFFIKHLGRPEEKGWYRLVNTYGEGQIQKDVTELPIGGFISTKSKTKEKVSHITDMCEELNYSVGFIYE
jgi:hypothetical protein